MDIALYVAIAEDGVIGREGGLPWKLSSDLKRFKADTMDKPIIMGRKTWESIGRPLPGRLNIVVTRDTTYRAEGAEVTGSVEEAIALAKTRGRCTGISEIAIIGGGDIFRLTMPLADRIHVTHVLAKIEGDTFFPPIDGAQWHAVSSLDVPAGEKDSHATRYTVYERHRDVH